MIGLLCDLVAGGTLTVLIFLWPKRRLDVLRKSIVNQKLVQ